MLNCFDSPRLFCYLSRAEHPFQTGYIFSRMRVLSGCSMNLRRSVNSQRYVGQFASQSPLDRRGSRKIGGHVRSVHCIKTIAACSFSPNSKRRSFPAKSIHAAASSGHWGLAAFAAFLHRWVRPASRRRKYLRTYLSSRPGNGAPHARPPHLTIGGLRTSFDFDNMIQRVAVRARKGNECRWPTASHDYAPQ